MQHLRNLQTVVGLLDPCLVIMEEGDGTFGKGRGDRANSEAHGEHDKLGARGELAFGGRGE